LLPSAFGIINWRPRREILYAPDHAIVGLNSSRPKAARPLAGGCGKDNISFLEHEFFMGQEMTPAQSKQLKVGTRVCFDGDPADSGKVISIEAKYVTINWDDGHQSFTGHNEMKRVELVEPPKMKCK
jgi:hypothetical protein